MKLRDDWKWIVNHAWSIRLLMLAFVLSCAEAIMPLFTDERHPVLYAVLMGIITGAAFVSRIIAQKHVDLK